jgi:hypothetical protein
VILKVRKGAPPILITRDVGYRPKSVKSITLPNDTHVVVLASTLLPVKH